jgi:biopolymer transport protein TolQ
MILKSGLFGVAGSLGVVSQVVLFFLFLFSVLSWAVILYKWKAFRSADREDQRFIALFAKSKDLEDLLRDARRMPSSPTARVFQGMMQRVPSVSGDGLVSKKAASAMEESPVIDRTYLERTVGFLVQEQIAQLETYLPVLATTGNITPFIGLLGTVLGIIDSFREIGLQGTASIAAVAPGVSEALVATAAGLFTAIPAVIAYNYFLIRIRRAVFRLEAFVVEILRAVQARETVPTVGIPS